ncbi:MAG: hypothetical protein OJF51_004826 [Nitrospira sp.]|nr:MAG: hypothetical protein OJF51_004826 [Nitrospira sp.]
MYHRYRQQSNGYLRTFPIEHGSTLEDRGDQASKQSHGSAIFESYATI